MLDFTLWYVLALWVVVGFFVVYGIIFVASKSAMNNANPLEITVMRYWQVGFIVHGLICSSLITYIFLIEIVAESDFWYSFQFIFLIIFVLIDIVFAFLFQKWISDRLILDGEGN